MAPDQEDLNRQLEALQRYVADLTEQRKRFRGGAPPARWLLITGLLVVVALAGGLLVGAVAWSDDRPTAAGASAAGTSSATRGPDGAGTAVASPACKTAVDRANTMVATAVELRRTLAAYEKIVNDPANARLSAAKLRAKTDAVRKAGSGESTRLGQALAAYRQVVDQCQLQTP